jgi:hypothetical protein
MTLNPVYGQRMSSAALQAQQLQILLKTRADEWET